MKNFKRETHDPLELIKKFWPDADVSHIEYDPKMKYGERQYFKVKQSAHDGTRIFTIELLQELLLPLVNMATHYIPTEPDWKKVKGIKYKVGKIRHSTVYGQVFLRFGRCQGQRERVRIPIICEYIYDEKLQVKK